MEFTIDFTLVRAILKAERQQASDELTTLGALPALAASLQRMDQRLAGAADAATLACRSGCDWCCHFTIDVRPVEALQIASWMQREFSAEQRASVHAEIKANAQRLAAMDEDQRVQQNTRCPFLIEHRCSIYSVRPQTCRNYHATDARGCQQSYDEPDNTDIDPEFAPLVYQAGHAHVEAFAEVMSAAGHDMQAYELNGAMAATLADIEGTRRRFEQKQRVFPDLPGFDVEAEFLD